MHRILILNSFNEQYYKIPLIISISCEKEYKEKVIKILENNIKINNKIKYYFSNEKKSQFEHYKFIIDTEHDNFKDIWLIFCDDDDLLSKRRTVLYNFLIQQYNKKVNLFTDTIIYPYIMNCDTSIKNYNQFLLQVDETKFNFEKNNHDIEYINICTKYENIYEFINKADIKLLQHKLCDRYFRKYILSDKKNLTFAFSELFTFSYLYRIHDDSVCGQLKYTESNPITYYIIFYYSKYDTLALSFIIDLYKNKLSLYECEKIYDYAKKNSNKFYIYQNSPKLL